VFNYNSNENTINSKETLEWEQLFPLSLTELGLTSKEVSWK